MKKFILIFIFSLQYTTLIFSREVHVVPLYQERLTGKWCGLFARDAGGLWSTFKQKIEGNSDVLACAIQALKEQTNGIYDLDKQSLQKVYSAIALDKGNVVCCLPVKHITIPMLQQKMVKSIEQNVKKDKFIWLPMEDLLTHTTITKLVRNTTIRYKFDGFTKSIFSDHWQSKLQPQLNASINREKALALIPKPAQKKVVRFAKKEIKPTQPKEVIKIAKSESDHLVAAQRHNRFHKKAVNSTLNNSTELTKLQPQLNVSVENEKALALSPILPPTRTMRFSKKVATPMEIKPQVKLAKMQQSSSKVKHVKTSPATKRAMKVAAKKIMKDHRA